MRVMQIAGARTMGGLLVHLRTLTGGLVEAGHRVDVVLSPDPAVETLAGELARRGATVHRLGVRGKTDLAGLGVLKRRVAAVQPDVLHMHLSSPVEGTPALLAARWAGRHHRMVTTEHAPRYAPLRRFYSATVKRALGRSLDRVIAVCRADATYLVEEFGLEAGRIAVIHNGVSRPPGPPPARAEARARLGVPADAAFVIGYAGGLSAPKGVLDLVEAATGAGIPRLVVVLAGAGPLRAELDARRGKLPYRLELVGLLPELAGFFAALDAFVLPSHSESMPLVVLEAMHAGLPIVSTAVGGVPEALEDGVSGLLVAPRRPAELRRALESLHRDSARAAAMGARARSVAALRFTADGMVRRTARLYEDVLGATAAT